MALSLIISWCLECSKMLDMSFMASVNDPEKYLVLPKRYDHLFRVRRVKVFIIIESSEYVIPFLL